MSNNWKPTDDLPRDEIVAKPAEPYIKSEREQKINALAEQIAAISEPTEEKRQLERELLKTIEGDQFFSTHDAIKILLLNGPPRSGKDTATDFALQHLGKRGARYRFAAPLKNTIHSMFGFQGVGEEHFSDVKDAPNPELFGALMPDQDPTWRQAYIWLSEKVVKPKFGHDFWSKIAVTMIKQMKKPVVVISDCGFKQEAEVLINAFGKKNVLIVHLERDGCDFAVLKDSRSYIEGECETVKLSNNGTVHELYDNMAAILDKFAPEQLNAK